MEYDENNKPYTVLIIALALFGVLFVAIAGRFFFISTAMVNNPSPGFIVNARMAVDSDGHSDWTGTVAGLKYPDVILAADGYPVKTMEDLLQAVSKVGIGTAVEYTVLRGAQQQKISVPTMMFGWPEYLIRHGLNILVAFCFATIAFIVVILKRTSLVSWVFFIASYCIAIVMLTLHPDPILIRVLLVVEVLELAAALHFGLIFPYKSDLVAKYPGLQVIPYIVAILMIAALEYYYPSETYLNILNLRLLFQYTALFVVLQAIFRQFMWPRDILAKQRARVLLVAAILAFPVPVTIFALNVLFGVDYFPVWINLPFLLFPLAIAYSIVKHNLFDVDSYVKRTVGYVIMTIILASGYLGIQSGVRYLVGPLFGDAADHIYPILYAVMVVFLFNPVNVRIQSVVDRLFYRKEYDFKEVVERVERSLTSVLGIKERMQRLINSLDETLFLNTAGITVFPEGAIEGNSYFEISSEDAQEALKTSGFRIARSNPLTELVMRENKLITRFDIEEDIHYLNNKNAYLEQFDNLDASICLPLTHNDETFGVVFLGNKKSGKFFNNQDIDLVKMITARGAVAIDNAQLVEQMKKEEEVRGNLARYLSPEIVERVVSDDMEVNLGGQRKVVSVMFSDIRDFTTISESWPPDQLVTILNEYMTEMVSIVFKHRGSIDKFVGDAIVAVYGSLIELDNQAESAVKAVFDMQEKLKELNVRWQKEYGVDMKIGCGINTGEVFLGNIGSPDRMEFTVIGDAVNLSARLEGLTKFYGVGLIVSEYTKANLDDIVCRKLDRVLVKGKRKAVEIYEPVCLVADADDQLRSELETYNEALGYYYEQRWDDASAILSTLHNQHPERKIYTLYLERIEALRDAGLAADWDGAFVHTSK